MRKCTKYSFKMLIIFSERHNLMTKLCRTLLKCEIKLKIVEKINVQLFSVLK